MTRAVHVLLHGGSCRVRLVKELTPELPLGTEGTVDRPNIAARGMYMVKWDNGLELPMYRSEIEPVADGNLA